MQYLSCAIIALLLSLHAAAGTISFSGVGTLPGDYTSGVAGISGNGLVVVGESDASGGYPTRHPVRYSGGLMSNLTNPAITYNASGAGVSRDGTIAVGNGDANLALRFQGGVAIAMPKLPNGTTEVYVSGISGDGTKAVGSSGSTPGDQAVRWVNDVPNGLGDLAGGSYSSYGNGISDDGSTVVGYSASANGNEAFRWQNGTMAGLGALSSLWFQSSASACSADGSIVVGNSRVNQSDRQAVRWVGQSISGLGYLSGGGRRSEALAVSGTGDFVVGFSGDFSSRLAFLWDPTNGMRNLKDVLQSDYGLNLGGWTLSEAVGISLDGQTIVGNGKNPAGYSEGWIATLPEPGTIGLLAVGSLWVIRRR